MDRGLSSTKPLQLGTDYSSAFIIVILFPPLSLRHFFSEQWLPCDFVLTLSMPNVFVFIWCLSKCVCCRSEHACYMWISMHGCWSFGLLLYIILQSTLSKLLKNCHVNVHYYCYGRVATSKQASGSDTNVQHRARQCRLGWPVGGSILSAGQMSWHHQEQRLRPFCL